MPRLSTDSGGELARALGPGGYGGEGRIEELVSTPWCSATFAGARHRLAIRFDESDADSAADSFLDGLEEREFALRGHLVADIVVVGKERRPGSVLLRLEGLTVEDF